MAKKNLFLIFLTALVMCACVGHKGDPGPMGPQGPKGDPGEGVNWFVKDFDVQQNEWKYSNISDGTYNNYFSAFKDVPELTSFIFYSGNVQAYLYSSIGDIVIQHSLPYVMPFEDINANLEQEGVYTTTIDFIYGVGWVQFEMRDSDFGYEVADAGKEAPSYVPTTMTFRLVMTW